MGKIHDYGCTVYFNNALKAAKQVVKTGGGELVGWHLYNLDASVTYLQFFDAVTANVTVGTTAPTFVIAVPSSGWVDDPSVATPIKFSNGLIVAATTTYNGLTPQTNGLLTDLFYA